MADHVQVCYPPLWTKANGLTLGIEVLMLERVHVLDRNQRHFDIGMATARRSVSTYCPKAIDLRIECWLVWSRASWTLSQAQNAD